MAADAGRKSLRDLVFKQSGFLVNPLQWTARHLDLVGCRFEDADPAPVPAPTHTESTQDETRNNGGSGPVKKPRSDAEIMSMNLAPVIKRCHLANILEGEERAFTSHRQGHPFYFQGRPVHRPDYVVFYRPGTPVDHIRNSSTPLVGYVHYTSVSSDRRKQFEGCPGPGGTPNYIGARICSKRLAQTTPTEWTEDPYFLCHLLALAQLQARLLLNSPQPSKYTSHLLVTNGLEKEYILFYMAEFTTELLNGLQNPKDATIPVKWPTIRRKRIPFKPYDTFASRLVAELVAPDPVGDHSRKHAREDSGSDQIKYVRRTK